MSVGRPVAILAALVLAALALVGFEAARGRANPAPRIANPCLPRAGTTGDAAQQIVLAGLDRAACNLHLSREALVLRIAGSTAGGGPKWSKAQITAAVRAGLLGSLHEAANEGLVPAFTVPLIERLIRETPLDAIVRGGFDLQHLFG